MNNKDIMLEILITLCRDGTTGIMKRFPSNEPVAAEKTVMRVQEKASVMALWMKENAVIYVCTTVMVLGLYAMSNSWHSLWALVMLAFVNFPRTKP